MRTHPYSGPLQGVPSLHVYKLDPRARLPTHANEYAVGLDVYAFLLTESGRPTSRAIHQRGVTEIPTGIVVRPSDGYFVEVRSRSGLARKSIVVPGGIIDPDYSGELSIMLYNGGFETHYVAHEHRIAQLILTPITRCNLVEESGILLDIGRGKAGYGSTGL